MAVNLEYYKVFYYVAEYSNITRASEKLCLSQPTVTREIKGLEEQIGCRLFQRTTKGVMLTVEGKVLYDYVRPAYQMLIEAEERMKRLLQLEDGMVSFNVRRDITKFLTRSVIRKMQQLYPNVTLITRELPPQQMRREILNNNIDFGFEVRPTTFKEELNPETGKENGMNDRSLCVYSLLEFEYLVCAGPKIAEELKSVNKVEKIVGYPLLIYMEGDNTGLRYVAELFYGGNELKEEDISTTDIAVCKRMVIKGQGIGILPSVFVEDELKEKSLVRIPVQLRLPAYELILVCNGTCQPSIVAQKMIEITLQDKQFSQKLVRG